MKFKGIILFSNKFLRLMGLNNWNLTGCILVILLQLSIAAQNDAFKIVVAFRDI